MKSPINLAVPPGGPSPQAEFDIFSGHWAYHIPVEGAVTGQRPTFFHQPELIRLIKTYFSNHAEMDVLELGPHEAEQSFHLHHLPVRHVYSIEGRPSNFLKCLIVKNQLSLDRVRFSVGDFVEYLKHGRKLWDIVYCAGILYHMKDPAEVLYLISKRTKNLVMSTHFFDENEMRAADERTATDKYPTGWLKHIDETGVRVSRYGIEITYHERIFSNSAEQIISGQGASHSLSANFMMYDDIVRLIEAVGGRILHIKNTANGRGPHLDAVVSFSS